MKGRDDKLISTLKSEGYTPVDILYGMIQYQDSTGARDIPSFVRYMRHNPGLMTIDQLVRETCVAEYISGERIPVAGWAYFDLVNSSPMTANESMALRIAQQLLQQWVDGILGYA